jgi:hypothetical protein
MSGCVEIISEYRPGIIANETLYQLSYTPVYLSTKCTKGAFVQAALIRSSGKR